jgi:hypothetical protein
MEFTTNMRGIKPNRRSDLREGFVGSRERERVFVRIEDCGLVHAQDED